MYYFIQSKIKPMRNVSPNSGHNNYPPSACVFAKDIGTLILHSHNKSYQITTPNWEDARSIQSIPSSIKGRACYRARSNGHHHFFMDSTCFAHVLLLHINTPFSLLIPYFTLLRTRKNPTAAAVFPKSIPANSSAHSRIQTVQLVLLTSRYVLQLISPISTV